MRARLLGPFCLSLGDKKATWARPPAKRLCELVLLSPGGRIFKDAACEALFAGRAPPAAAHELSPALSTSLRGLGVHAQAQTSNFPK